MSIQHFAVFALLGAAFVGWTIYSKRKEAEALRAAERERQKIASEPK